jgi:hypothetical protein
MTFKPRRPRRPNVGMIFGRMVRRLGRDSGDAQLAKAGQDLLRRSYKELQESEPDLASPTNPSAQSHDLQTGALERLKAAPRSSQGLSDFEKDDRDTDKMLTTLERMRKDRGAK